MGGLRCYLNQLLYNLTTKNVTPIIQLTAANVAWGLIQYKDDILPV